MEKMEPLSLPPALGKVRDASWPSSLPEEDEEQLLSIVCGNSNLHWAIHHGPREAELAPSLFWRTPHLSDEDVTPSNQTDSLSRHLPKYAHELIFGVGAKGTLESAVEESKKRKVQLLTVYIVSTNNDQLQRLGLLWSGGIPCRLFVLNGGDFFTEDQGRRAGMGTDRLATLAGGVAVHGYPALVFDGGTATTYTAADENGRIMGGGIGPGIAVKLKSLQDYTGLPHISIDQVMERLKQKSPIPIFATSTEDAIVGRVLSEMSHAGRSVIKSWLSKVGTNDKSSDNAKFVRGMKHNKERAVVLTGGDGEIISQLCLSDYGGILEGSSPINVTGFDIMHAKHLIHYGIQAAVMEKVREKRREDDIEIFLAGDTTERVAGRYMGKRVAKWFKEPDKNGDNIYRGSVTKIFKGETGDNVETVLFHIDFDDGDGEDVEIDELDELLKYFEHCGELSSEKKGQKQRGKKRGVNRDKKRGTSTSNRPKPAMPAPKPKRSKSDYSSNPDRFVGSRIAKDFGDDMGVFFGTIREANVEEDQVLWVIAYDDGDKEDFDEADLRRAHAFYELVKDQDNDRDELNQSSGDKSEKSVEKDVAAEKCLADSTSSEGDALTEKKDVDNDCGKEAGAAVPSGPAGEIEETV